MWIISNNIEIRLRRNTIDFLHYLSSKFEDARIAVGDAVDESIAKKKEARSKFVEEASTRYVNITNTYMEIVCIIYDKISHGKILNPLEGLILESRNDIDFIVDIINSQVISKLPATAQYNITVYSLSGQSRNFKTSLVKNRSHMSITTKVEIRIPVRLTEKTLINCDLIYEDRNEYKR